MHEHGWRYSEEKLKLGEIPHFLQLRYPLVVSWLTGEHHPPDGRGSRCFDRYHRGPVVRLVRSLNTIRESVLDRHIARYIVGYIRCAGDHKLNREAIRALRDGNAGFAEQLAGFWRDLLRYTLDELSEKPEIHG